MKRWCCNGVALPRAIARAATMTGALLMSAACSSPAVEWSQTEYPVVAPLRAHSAPVAREPADACPGSFRADSMSSGIYAAWWRVRPDSSSVLMAGRSIDGGENWIVVVPADTLDRSRRGCTRPPPAIWADEQTQYVDFAYFLESAEGPGIFFTHTMDAAHMGSGVGVFHSPVSVVYGTTPSRVSVAAAGSNVAVAYEDPNAERPMIGAALSRSMGHIFETRSTVSGRDLPAVHPLVALSGGTVTVQWIERPDSVTTGGRVAVKRGRWH